MGVILGIIIGFLSRKYIAEAKIGSAEDRAGKIVDDAKKEAENKKKEILLEAKEESIKTKNELEKEVRERRNELQRTERRLIQKEETLDRKADSYERKEEILSLAAIAEQNSNHPIAKSIMNAYHQDLENDYILTNIAGQGIMAKKGNQVIFCGNESKDIIIRLF